MDLTQFLGGDAIVADLAVANKKALFQALGGIAERSMGLNAKEVVDRLAERERLGTTGFGGGVAIPHGRLAELDGIRAAFVRLERPIDYGAIDDLPIDLVFMLLSPADAGADHLKALAQVSRRLRDRAFVANLRGAVSPDALYALFASAETRDAA
ncbi:phosphotransferase system enzyme IIA component PtsN [Sphingomonas changbaiensis NBRC 104936]|uniref:Phosphotransferase system enzyme IIA component PtsN n=1 Tax=Sphingomonas changbaiensis NBRC 104936 TaxID=1219043 RepID=A0A0E9MRH2_9SPHN|nr:PTS sugar transporter subunit IIA [Sphingomonas changbaiensis]GAO40078.1 phosphotransferase system enzyme IIA component PtsN [Sphingomonas changbaiensis NBRC 104936]